MSAHASSETPEKEIPARLAAAKPCPVNAMSIDVEDYFQVEAFKSIVDRGSWDARPARVAENTLRVAEMLDVADVRATFFVLGWVAERFPQVVRQLAAGGHEIASHGSAHQLASVQTASEFRDDVRRAKSVLEDISGNRVRGYRAPTFSIGSRNSWAYDILAEEGHEYSSSVYPIAHDLYGMPEAPRGAFRPLRDSGFLEIPISTVRLLNKNRPCGGGGYFRLLPYAVSRWSMRRVNNVDSMPCVFYCHPWEFDPGQPRFSDAPLKSRIRHYLNLDAMAGRMARLLSDFKWGRVDDIFLGQS